MREQVVYFGETHTLLLAQDVRRRLAHACEASEVLACQVGLACVAVVTTSLLLSSTWSALMWSPVRARVSSMQVRIVLVARELVVRNPVGVDVLALNLHPFSSISR